MKIISFTEANKDFKAVLDTLNKDTDMVCIERQNSNDAVIMSLAHLAKSIAQYEGSQSNSKN